MDTVHKKTLPADLSAPPAVDAWRNRALLVGAVFGILSLIAAFFDYQHFIRGYLVAFTLWTGMSIGCLALLMVQYLSGGKWGLMVRRILEAGAANLYWLWILFIPIALSTKLMYGWANHDLLDEAGLKAVEFRAHFPGFLSAIPYQTNLGFIVRGFGYFVIWIGFAYFLRKWSIERDREMGHGAYWRIKFENISGVGVLIYVLTLTFAVIDWIMSTDATWYSSIYGLLYLAGQGLGCLSILLITLTLLSRFDPIKTLLRKTELHDIGKLTLAFVMLYAYFAFSQFLIIWSGNLAQEVPWYLNRLRGGWGFVAMAVVLGHFVLPFLLLLSRNLKRNKAKIAPLACFILCMRLVDLIWLTAPNFKDSQKHFPLEPWMLDYLIVPIAIGGFWAAGYFWNLKQRPLIQINDSHLEEILEPEHAAV